MRSLQDHARRAASWLGWSSLVLGILPLLITVVGKGLHLPRPSFWGSGFLTIVWVIALALGMAAGTASTIASRTAGLLRAEGNELLVAEGSRLRRIAAHLVESALVRPGKKGRRTHVELLLADGERVTTFVGEEATAKAILGSVGIDLSRRTAHTKVDPAFRWVALLMTFFGSFLAGPVFLPVGRESAGGMASWFAFVATAFVASMLVTATPEVTVGLDGLHIDGLRRRFVGFEGVVDVEPTRLGIALGRSDGTRESVSLYAIPTALRLAQRSAIVESIREALAHRAAAGGRALAALARAGRPFETWREAITEAVRGGYRQAGLSLEVLTDAIARADASAEERIAAAIALTASRPDEVERIRVAARACADPKVRVALDRVAQNSGGDAEVASAIEEALAEEARRARA